MKPRTTGGDNLWRLAAFPAAPGGGNPAGVWIGDSLPEAADMQRIAAEVGYSETAFVAPRNGTARSIRYYSPEAEVSFCGHATIASGAIIGREDGPGRYELDTAIGIVPIEVHEENGNYVVSLESVEPRHKTIDSERLGEYLAAIGWQPTQLDEAIAPVIAYAGAWHLVIAVRERETLASLDYDFETLKALMLDDDVTTLQLVWREAEGRFHARDPFPVGGVVEDPATGAAAAALGGYLRDGGLVVTPASFKILQGQALGRPSTLYVDVPDTGGIVVSGFVVDLDDS